MKLSNDYQYIVLCEDAQMKSFILQFLKAHGIRDMLEVNQSILPSLKMAKEEYQRVCLLQGQT